MGAEDFWFKLKCSYNPFGRYAKRHCTMGPRIKRLLVWLLIALGTVVALIAPLCVWRSGVVEEWANIAKWNTNVVSPGSFVLHGGTATTTPLDYVLVLSSY